MVQGLRLQASIVRGIGSVSGWGTKILHALWRGQKNKKMWVLLPVEEGLQVSGPGALAQDVDAGRRAAFPRRHGAGVDVVVPGDGAFGAAVSLDQLRTFAEVIDLKSLAGIDDAPRGFREITLDQFRLILKETRSDQSFIIDQA